MNFQAVGSNRELISAWWLIVGVKFEVKQSFFIAGVEFIGRDCAIRARQLEIEQHVRCWLFVIIDPAMQQNSVSHDKLGLGVNQNRL